MRHWKKGICLMMATMMAMGTTADAYMAIDIPTNNVSQVLKTGSKEEDSSYIKKYNMIDDISDATIMGADFSHYQQDLLWKKVYYDYKANPIDNIFTFVKSQGVNMISVRVAVNPQGELEYLSLDNAVKTIKAAKESGLNTNIILMYSDEITYEKVQTLPQGWTLENAAEKAKEYTATVLSELEKENALPTMITVGNETNFNFLNLTADDGWNGWTAMGQITKLIKQKDVKVAIGIASPNQAEDIKWTLKKLNDPYTEIDYDCVGIAIYPDENTTSNMTTMRMTFEEETENKQLFVSSVKYPRVSSTDTSVGVKSQADNIYRLLETTIDKKNAGGLIYEEAEFVGSWNSFFDNGGYAQTSLAIFSYAQGKQVDVDTYRDPYEFGEDTGLKDQQVTINKVNNMSESSIRGMDISSYIALKEAGVKYYNHKGEEESLIKILHDNGVNYLRIRIWNDPYNEKGETYGGGNTDVENGLKIANEAKKYGMKLLLDFHYSDFWADPTQQIIPKAWAKDANDTNKMSQNVYNFTKQTIQKFKDAGAEIGMVQVGNEITNGMLGILVDRDKGGNYYSIWGNKEKSSTINQYLKAGSKAVREAAPDALIALHLETSNVTKYTNIMNTWERDGVDYDVLGSSYYPYWSVSQKANTPQRLKDIQKLAASKGKLFAILEVAWVNSLNDSDGTPNSIGASANTSAYQVGPQGQVDCLNDMYEAMMTQENGLGSFYWEPAWIPVKAGWTNWAENKKIADEYGTGWASKGALGYFSEYKMYYHGEPAWGGTSWDNQGLFDPSGYALQSLKFYSESISKGKEQTSVIHLVDANNKEIAANTFAKVELGTTRTINIPTVPGYEVQNKASNLKITGEVDGVKHYYIKYTKVQEIKSKKTSYTMITGTTLDLGKEITLASQGTVKYSSSNSKVVSIDSKTGKMTAKAIGTVTITITADKTNYCTAATKKITVKVSPKTVLNIKSKNSTYKMTYKDSLDLRKELTLNTNATLKYSSSNSKVVSIDSKTGKMTAKEVGTAVITVKADETASTTAATKKINVTVLPKVTVKNKGVQNVAYGSIYKLSSYMTISGKCTKKFTSSNQSIAKVNSNGTITALKTGKVTITAKITAAGSNTSIQKKVTVYVVPKKQKVSKVTASSKALTVSLNKDRYASGYQVMVATDNNFTVNKKSVYIKKNSTLNSKVSGLKAGKQYYVRVRSYKVISNKNYYGSWSTVIKSKTK